LRGAAPFHADCLSTRDFSRILLIKPSALGDVIHTIPVLAKLRARYPRARIDWLLTPENAQLLQHHPALSGTVAFDRQKLRTFGRCMHGTVAGLRLLAHLYRSRYDLVIDLHGQLRSAFFSLATRASARVGFDKPVPFVNTRSGHYSLQNRPRHGWRGAREGSWIAYTHHIPIPALDMHAIERYLCVGRLLGFDESAPDMRIFLSPETEASARTLLTSNGIETFALLVPGTIWETKRWPAERFAEVGRILQTCGLGIVIGGTMREKALCARVAHLCPRSLDLSGRTSPADLAAIIRLAEVCVTNDSGSMHLAVALKRPVVSIFGPTNPVHIGPFNHPASVLRVDLPCSPCNYRRLSQCPHGQACMWNVTASMVIARIENLLGPRAFWLRKATLPATTQTQRPWKDF
jgi:lipopolysaccharide heptosyltransferase I